MPCSISELCKDYTTLPPFDAKSAGQRAGIVRANCAAPVIPYDYLSYATILPVFPELAAPLNLPGSCLFKRPGNQVQMNGNTLLLNLDEMVAESYEIYSRYPPEALHHSRMQAIARILSEVVR